MLLKARRAASPKGQCQMARQRNLAFQGKPDLLFGRPAAATAVVLGFAAHFADPRKAKTEPLGLPSEAPSPWEGLGNEQRRNKQPTNPISNSNSTSLSPVGSEADVQGKLLVQAMPVEALAQMETPARSHWRFVAMLGTVFFAAALLLGRHAATRTGSRKATKPRTLEATHVQRGADGSPGPGLSAVWLFVSSRPELLVAIVATAIAAVVAPMALPSFLLVALSTAVMSSGVPLESLEAEAPCLRHSKQQSGPIKDESSTAEESPMASAETALSSRSWSKSPGASSQGRKSSPGTLPETTCWEPILSCLGGALFQRRQRQS